MGDECLIEVEVRQVVSANGVRHLQLIFEDVVYSAEGCNLDQTEIVSATKSEDVISGEPCQRESAGINAVAKMHIVSDSLA